MKSEVTDSFTSASGAVTMTITRFFSPRQAFDFGSFYERVISVCGDADEGQLFSTREDALRIWDALSYL